MYEHRVVELGTSSILRSLMAPVCDCKDSIGDEVENMTIWSNENRMPLNMEKTYEMTVRAKMSTSLPEYIPSIKRKEWL